MKAQHLPPVLRRGGTSPPGQRATLSPAWVPGGIVSGVGGGRFSPNGKRDRGTQLAKMLLAVCCLSYDANIEDLPAVAGHQCKLCGCHPERASTKGLSGLDVSAHTDPRQRGAEWCGTHSGHRGSYKYTLVGENDQLVSKVGWSTRLARVTLLGRQVQRPASEGI